MQPPITPVAQGPGSEGRGVPFQSVLVHKAQNAYNTLHTYYEDITVPNGGILPGDTIVAETPDLEDGLIGGFARCAVANHVLVMVANPSAGALPAAGGGKDYTWTIHVLR